MVKNFVEKLREAAHKTGSIACFGMDPTEKVYEAKDKPKSPAEYAKGFSSFYHEILYQMKKEGVWPGSFKPNDAYWAQWDRQRIGAFDGSLALVDTIAAIRSFDDSIPIVLDAKRGDIGATSTAYAKEFAGWSCGNTEFGWAVDGMTVHNYMGSDSVLPFAEKLGIYVMDRNSNPGAAELQSRLVLRNEAVGKKVVDPEKDLMPVYMVVAESIVGWAKKCPGNVGAVVGATAPEELECIARFFVESGSEIPILIPGVGKQGGSASDVASRLKKVGYDLSIVRISSSSELNYAFAKEGTRDFAGASVRALKKLNDEIDYRP